MGKKGKVPGNAYRTKKQKNSHLNWEIQNHWRGRSQQEVDHLTANIPPNDGRTSVTPGGEAFKGGDKPVDGTARRTRKGKTIEK